MKWRLLVTGWQCPETPQLLIKKEFDSLWRYESLISQIVSHVSSYSFVTACACVRACVRVCIWLYLPKTTDSSRKRIRFWVCTCLFCYCKAFRLQLSTYRTKRRLISKIIFFLKASLYSCQAMFSCNYYVHQLPRQLDIENIRRLFSIRAS